LVRVALLPKTKVVRSCRAIRPCPGSKGLCVISLASNDLGKDGLLVTNILHV
jgi:hypothetical protein